MAKPAPTPEQQKIIEAAKTGQNLVIEAGAGTGKTSTLRMIAAAVAPKRGLYIAYNKAIQTEAQGSFPANVDCYTAHALAHDAIIKKDGWAFGKRLSAKRMPSWDVAKLLGIRSLFIEINDEGELIRDTSIAILVKEAIGRFCNSADTAPQAKHIPHVDGVKDRTKLVNHILPYVQAAWKDITDPQGRLVNPYFSHDCYLKMWSLSNPQTGYDFILFDEAQDANPCIAHVVGLQKGQQIMVGDRAQAIYGWRGAVDAMKNFNATRLFLTQSFRFGNAVAEQANRWLALCETPLKIKGFDQIDSTVTTDPMNEDSYNAVLCRTNAGCIEVALMLQKSGAKTAFAGKGMASSIASFTKAAQKLMEGKRVEHPDLTIFKTWNEVQKAVKDGEANDLRMLVNLIDNHGVDLILEVCNNSRDGLSAEEQERFIAEGGVMVSTAHKAKGLEWDAVRIHGDFKGPKEEEGTISIAEAMLIYVAVTRAKRHLDVSALNWLDAIERHLAAVGESL